MDRVWGAQDLVTKSSNTLSQKLADQAKALNAVENAARGAWQEHLRLADVQFNQTFGQVGLFGQINPTIGVPLDAQGTLS